jgi:hypothetical protein
LKYVPNNPYSIGIGIGTRKLLLDLGINIKGKSKDITKRFDIQLSMIHNTHFFDFYLQRYQGYNAENDIGISSTFRNDLISLSAGLKYLYFFNKRNYSLAAEKSGHSRQKKTATSFGLGSFLFIKNLSADSSLIPMELSGNFNQEAQLTKLFGISIGIHGSFTAIFPLPFHFFTSLSISPGIGLMLKNIETEYISYTPSDPLLYKLEMAGAFGYNGNRIYITFRLGFDFYRTYLDYGNKALFNTTNAKLALGYKLRKKQ